MGLNSFLTYYKKKVKEDSKDVNLKDCVNTITCGFENILQQNAFVTKNPKIGTLKRTVYTGNDSIDTSFFDNFNKNSEIVPFKDAVDNIVEWTSDLKMIASSFNNFLWTRIIENNDTVMEINDAFYTQVFNAVSGKKSCYAKYFDEFALKFKIGYYFPWMSNTSQVICHIKNEMATVTTSARSAHVIFMNACVHKNQKQHCP